MILKRLAGYFYITFEPPDWENPAGGATEFIAAIKAEIPNATVNGGAGWSYDGQTHQWEIPDTPVNEELLTSYRDRFLPAPTTQQNLF